MKIENSEEAIKRGITVQVIDSQMIGTKEEKRSRDIALNNKHAMAVPTDEKTIKKLKKGWRE